MATCPTCRSSYADDVSVCTKDGAALLPDRAFKGADAPLARGAVIGEWSVDDAIAEGGFGTVYRVTHQLIGKSAAIKILKREFSANPEMVSRFISEARAVNQIRHKNIIDIFAFGVLEDGRHYYVMELLEGETLDRFIRKRGRVQPTEALPIIRQLGRALGAAHATGITHRDLKPENVFLVFDEDGTATPKLLDFGIAKLRADSASAHRTRDGAPMGTPLYMSPEQVHARSVDHRSDIYSMGVLIHEVLTGDPPFDGESVMDVLTAQTTQRPRAVSVLAPIARELDEPILAMLEKEPDRRPQTVSIAMDALMEAAERAGILPRRSAPGISGDVPRIATPSSPRYSPTSAAVTLAQPDANATTAPGTIQASRPPSRRMLAAALGIVTAVGGGVLAVRGLGSGPPAEPSATAPASAERSDPGLSAPPAPIVTASSAPPAGSSSANVSDSVKIAFDCEPADAEIVRDGVPVGTAGTPVDIARGTRKLTFTVRRKGYITTTVGVVPDRDRTVSTKLTRLPATQTPGRGDLEF